MVIRATSDLHLTQTNAEHVFATLDQLEEDARKTGGLTMLLGDILNQAKTVHMPTWNRLRTKLRHWPGDGVKVLVGNHDQYDRPKNALEGLEGGKCRVVSVPSWSAEGTLIPYTPPEEFAAAVESVTPYKALPIVWCHHGFRGAYQNAMTRDRQGVPCSTIPDDHMVITGHYHLPQTLGRIVYCGSPIEHSFAEEGQYKGWLRWEDATDDMIPHRIAFKDTGAPKHVTIDWDPAGVLEYSQTVDRRKDKVRIRTLATRSEVKRYSKMIADAGLAGVPILAQPDAGGRRGVVNAGATPEQAVQQFIDAVHGSDLNLPTPSEMYEWAKEHEIMVIV